LGQEVLKRRVGYKICKGSLLKSGLNGCTSFENLTEILFSTLLLSDLFKTITFKIPGSVI